jgi:predicted Zn-dependent protease with MMP-like domain
MTLRLSEELEREVDTLLDEFEELLESEPERALDLAEKVRSELREHPDVELARARAVWAVKGPAAARSALELLVARFPDFADAHHVLGSLHEETGDVRRQIEHFLIVRRLDAEQDAEDELDSSSWEDFIADGAEQVLEALPSPFRERLAGVPVLIEQRPSFDLVQDGFDPRSLGLFEGPSDQERALGEPSDRPTRIVLYAANLLANFSDPDELLDEVEITVRHEIGHFFGLEEDDMERLGLD